MERKLKLNTHNFRKKNDISSVEPIPFESLLQRLNIITLFRAMDENFSGLSVKSDDAMFMLINSNQSLGRQHFTIAHEFYHLFYDPMFEPHICQTGKFPVRNQQERMADIFASHLLLPEDGVLDFIPDEEAEKDKITLATLLKLEQTFGASRSALLQQLLKFDLITKKYKEEFSTYVIAGARQYGYNSSLYLPTKEHEIIGTYGTLANKLFDDEKISESHFNELMLAVGVDIDELFANEED